MANNENILEMVRGRGNGRVVANHVGVGHSAPRCSGRVPVPRVPAAAHGLRTNVLRGRGLGRGVRCGKLPVDEVAAETSVHLVSRAQDFIKLKEYRRTDKKKEEGDLSVRQGHQDAQGQNRKRQRDDRPLDTRVVVPSQGTRILSPCFSCEKHGHLVRRCPRREGQHLQQRSHKQG
ncbi:hypothetical protein GIB67_031009 [Kingdonia uniflora]|uniref:CCHC-type domain-containing protein n=1 Tax=Kingdonia uniflora TaxID=39325 RepID=A0A7J7NGB8_9MAGN|nr:hypothetical protein GIB67_031009 [Kingdonia uniflora]